MELTAEKVSELEDRSIEIIQFEQWRYKKLKNLNSFRDLWYSNKISNIHAIGVLEERKECNSRNNNRKIMAENFSKFIGSRNSANPK